MPRPDESEHTELPRDSSDTLDGILGAAFGREDHGAEGSSEPADAPAAPETIGPFRILKTLGRGGMGSVYLAEDTRLAHRRVAIKVLTGAGAGEGPPRERLLREAEAASKLDHPGICAVYEVGEADGVPYIAMRHVAGEPLNAKIQRAREALASGAPSALLDPPDAASSGVGETSGHSVSGGRAETSRVIHLIEKTARALHTAHESHLIHRDVKPANIMVTPYGEPVLLDFGLARMADSELPSLTRTGQIVGTPAYMAPEQIDGSRGTTDRRADVFGLGVTLYECLALRQPFAGATREQLYRSILDEEPTALRRINPRQPKDLEAVVATALEKSPVRRYQTALELAEDLRRVREHEPTRARPIRPLERLARYARRRPTRAALIALLAVGVPLVAGMAGYIVANRPMIAAQEKAARRKQVEGHLQVGFDALLAGANQRALREFNATLLLEPACIEAVGGKALAELDAGGAAACLAVLRDHASMLQQEPALRLLEADALMSLGRRAESEALMDPRPRPRGAFGFFLEGAREMRTFLTERSESRFRKALECFRLAVMSTPHARPLYHRHWAQVANRLDDPVIARRVAVAVRAAWPDSAMAWASACVALGRIEPKEALIAIDRAIELSPDDADFHCKRGAVLARLDRREECLEANQRAIACDPESVLARSGLGVALSYLDRNEEAIEVQRDATRRAPRWYLPWRRLARVLFLERRLDESLTAVDQSLRLRDGDLDAWILKGDVLATQGEHDDALEAFRRAVAIDARHAPGHRGIGRILYGQRKFDAAAAALERAIECDPEYAPAYADLGATLRAKGGDDLDTAIEMLRKAVAMDPDNASVLFHLGRAYQDRSDHALAIGVYDRVIALEPGSAKAHNNRGAAHYRVQNFDRAIADARKAIELRPGYVAAYGLLGTVLSYQKDFEAAAKVFEEATNLAPGYPSLWFSLAQMRARLGDRDASLIALQRCMAVAKPSWRDYRRARNSLGKTEMRVLLDARGAAIIGFGTRTRAKQEARAHALARDSAVEHFELLIEGWLQAVKRGGSEARRVPMIMENLFGHPGFAGIPESEAFKQLPETQQARWIAVWRALKKLE